MNWLCKISQFDSLDKLFNLPKKSVVRKDPPQSESHTLTLYRGFDADISKLEKRNGNYILSPHKSEQGVLWFTHDLINAYNAREYVSGRGKYILEYPLQCLKHYQRIHYNDGSHYDDIPQEISEKSEPTENCKFYRGYELPDGWFFSYKMEKFIICTIPIEVSSAMISEDLPQQDETY